MRMTVLALVLLAADSPAGGLAREPRGLLDFPRLRISLNDGWRYMSGDVEDAHLPEFDDSGWQVVDLPHTWNAKDALDGDGDYRRGVGWYRKEISMTPDLCRRQLFLHFEGANQTAEVWVSGKRLGRHSGGYTAFAFDMHAFEMFEMIRCDEPNTVAVRVDNAHDPDIPPLDADFTFYGGIYRDVWLIATGLAHLDLVGATPGVFVDTHGISDGRARVRVRGQVVSGYTDVPLVVRAVHRVLDADGDTVATFETGRLDVVHAQDPVPFESVSDPIERPRLWSPDDPYLYRVVTEVIVGRTVTDRVEVPFGFRWIDVDPERGFLLNGEPLALHGTNRHQDRQGYGNALPDSLHAEDLRLIKETGFNFVRLAHYPQDPAMLDTADSLGLLVWEEIPVVNLISPSQEFAENAERMLVEMIRQHYNHPSIAFWGYMNEVRLRDPEPMPEGYEGAVLSLAERLDARAHVEDPTRPTAIAVSLNEIEAGTALLDVADVLGLNLYFGWYYRDLADLGGFLDSLHAALPERPLFVSEYGAGSDERVHAAEPQPFDFSSEYIRTFHEATLPQLVVRPWLVGTAVWNQFDFGSSHRQDTKPSLNQKGLHFFDRTPKDVAYYYRAKLLQEPVLHIASREWTRRSGSRPGDRRQPIAVYTNLRRVELFHDGASLGAQSVDDGIARWTVSFHDGPNRLRARAVAGDTTANLELPVSVSVEDELVIDYHDRTPLLGAFGATTVDGPAAAGRALAVNAGAAYAFVDDAGTVWEPDREYEVGSWGHMGGEATRTHRRIHRTGDEPLYQAARVGAEAYRFDVQPGVYEVTIELAEVMSDVGPGARVFGITVNEEPVFAGLDLAAEHGPDTAVQRTLVVEITTEKGIEVRLTAQNGETSINGILIRWR